MMLLYCPKDVSRQRVRLRLLPSPIDSSGPLLALGLEMRILTPKTRIVSRPGSHDYR